MAVVPEWYANEFLDRASKVSIHDRPITAYVEQQEREDSRTHVVKEKGKKGMEFIVTDKMIFRFNNLEKINDDDYYARTYGRRLIKNLSDTRRNDYKSYINQAIILCGVKFESIVYRKIGKKNIKEVITQDDVSSYWLRRSAITRLLSAGIPVDAVKTFSGHSASSKSFERYVDKAAVLTSDDNIEKLSKLNRQ